MKDLELRQRELLERNISRRRDDNCEATAKVPSASPSFRDDNELELRQQITALENRIMVLLEENQELRHENRKRENWINPNDCRKCRLRFQPSMG